MVRVEFMVKNIISSGTGYKYHIYYIDWFSPSFREPQDEGSETERVREPDPLKKSGRANFNGCLKNFNAQWSLKK